MPKIEFTPQDRENMKIISERLTELSDKMGYRQTDISVKTGIPTPTLSNYFRGYSLPSLGNIQKLADFFGVLKSDIDPRFKTAVDTFNKINSKTAYIPIIGTIACGQPINAVQNIEGYVEELVDNLPKGSLFYLKAKGDSMAPTIPDGSQVLIREQADVENGEVAAVLLNETECTLKRIKKAGNVLLLMPDNQKYEPIIASQEMPCKILGKALRVNINL